MASQGPLSPGTTSNLDTGEVAWTNTDNVKVSDDVYSTVVLDGISGSSDVIYVRNFGFSIPTGSTIDGILIEVECKTSSGTNNFDTFIIDEGGDERGSKAGTMTTTEQYHSFGGATDLWGAAAGFWTVAKINSINFGSYVQNTQLTSNTLSVDHVRITVYYTESSGAQISTVNGVTLANTKTVNGLAIASVKKRNGLSTA